MNLGDSHHSSLVMLALLLGFALMHSGGASLRVWGEAADRSQGVAAAVRLSQHPGGRGAGGLFLAHRYDGLRLWNLQDTPVDRAARVDRHRHQFLLSLPGHLQPAGDPGPAAPGAALFHRDHPHQPPPPGVGQILWCATHLLWIGSSFMLVTCAGLIGHHLFGGLERRSAPAARFGEAFEELRASTSVIPFPGGARWPPEPGALRIPAPGPAGDRLTIGVFWWAHRFIGLAAHRFLAAPPWPTGWADGWAPHSDRSRTGEGLPKLGPHRGHRMPSATQLAWLIPRACPWRARPSPASA
jgi:uncharacterized membrane protein